LPLWQDTAFNFVNWGNASDYSTIRFVDVNGDFFPDICGRNANGISCALNHGSPTITPGWGSVTTWQSAFSDANSWNSGPQYYSTIQFALNF